MTGGAGKRRGQPLVAFVVLIATWVGVRATLWESPFPLPRGIRERLPAFVADARGLGEVDRAPIAIDPRAMPDEGWPQLMTRRSSRETSELAFDADRGGVPTAPASGYSSSGSRLMASQQLLWLAATADLPVPNDIAAMMDAAVARRRAASMAEPAAPSRVPPPPQPKRWSADAWLLWRAGSVPGGLAASPASYGASQAGIVARYRLVPGDARDPALYLRATRSLAPGGEGEMATGFSARPLAGVPVAVHAEVRLSDGPAGSEVRPSAFAVAGFGPKAVGPGIEAEAYGQAGYVGGRFATPFVDAQARATHDVASFDLGRLRAGGGVWGGAQKGAARLDIGPTASLDLHLAETPARVAVDYRVRIAGDAAPGSGVAVTLSTGF